MSDDRKNIIFLLNYITKKNQNQVISQDRFNQYAYDLGFSNLINNHLIYYTYAYNSKPGVNWNNIKFDPKTLTLLEKVKILKQNHQLDKELFDEDIDSFFRLDPSFSSNKRGGVYFMGDKIVFEFPDYDNDILLSTLNLSDEDMIYINAMHTGECYRVDDYGGDETKYVYSYLNTNNLKILGKILELIGEYSLSNIISEKNEINSHDDEDLVSEIVKALHEKIPELEITEDMFYEYSDLVEESSCDSIELSWKEHFPDGITLRHDKELWLSYDFLINYLSSNPNVHNFKDMEDYPMIELHTNFEDAYYQYDINGEKLNNSFETILTNRLTELETNDDYIFLSENSKEFLNIMNKLKFKKTSDSYIKEIGDLSIIIKINDIDFKNKTLKLIYKKNNKVRLYEIPFNEISDYIYTEKLYENLLKKILIN